MGSKNGNDSGGKVIIKHVLCAKCYARLSHVLFSRNTITVQGNYFQSTNEDIKNNRRH